MAINYKFNLLKIKSALLSNRKFPRKSATLANTHKDQSIPLNFLLNSNLYFDYSHISPCCSSLWVTCRLCRCFSRYAPSTNQLLSISLQMASLLWLRVRTTFPLRIFISSTVGVFLRFFDVAAAFAFAKALLTLICSRSTKWLSLIFCAGSFVVVRVSRCPLTPGSDSKVFWVDAYLSNNRCGWIFLRFRKMKFSRTISRPFTSKQAKKFRSAATLNSCPLKSHLSPYLNWTSAVPFT